MSLNSERDERSFDVMSTIEEVDKEVARSAARNRYNPVVETLGAASEIAD